MVSAPVLTAAPLEAEVVPVLPMEFEAWLRAALEAAELVEADDACVAEQAPLVGDVAIPAEAAVVGVDDVIGKNVEDELDVEEVDADVVVVLGGVAGSDKVVTVVPAVGVVVTMVVGVVGVMEIWEVEVDDVLVAEAVVAVDVVADDIAVDVLPTLDIEATAEAGEHAVPLDAVAAGGPDTVPAGAFVVCVPLADPPDVLTNMALRMSGFCQ
jgi:hypothetical protein